MLNISAANGNNIFRYSSDNGVSFVSSTLPDGFYDLNSLNIEISNILLTAGLAASSIEFQASPATNLLRFVPIPNFRWDATAGTLNVILGFNSLVYNLTTLGATQPKLNLGITSIFIELANSCKNKSFRNNHLPTEPSRISFCDYIYSTQLLLIPSASIEIISPSITYVDMVKLTEIDYFEIYIRDQNKNILQFTPDSEIHLIITKK